MVSVVALVLIAKLNYNLVMNELLQLCIKLNSDTFNIFFDVSFGKCRVSLILGHWYPNKKPALWKTFDVTDAEAIQRTIDKLENEYGKFKNTCGE